MYISCAHTRAWASAIMDYHHLLPAEEGSTQHYDDDYIDLPLHLMGDVGYSRSSLLPDEDDGGCHASMSSSSSLLPPEEYDEDCHASMSSSSLLPEEHASMSSSTPTPTDDYQDTDCMSSSSTAIPMMMMQDQDMGDECIMHDFNEEAEMDDCEEEEDDNEEDDEEYKPPAAAKRDDERKRTSSRVRAEPQRFTEEEEKNSGSRATKKSSKKKKNVTSKTAAAREKLTYTAEQRKLLLEGFRDFCMHPSIWRSTNTTRSVRMQQICLATGLTTAQVGKWFYARGKGKLHLRMRYMQCLLSKITNCFSRKQFGRYTKETIERLNAAAEEYYKDPPSWRAEGQNRIQLMEETQLTQKQVLTISIGSIN